MDIDLGALRVFVKLAEVESFTKAANHLEMPKARVSYRIKKLESDLETRLFHRSTRVVRLTPEGQLLLERAQSLLAEADDLGMMFQPERSVGGRVRLDLPVTLARRIVLPSLPELLADYPDLELTVSVTDRLVDPVREGFDCVLRVGSAHDPRLVGRRLGLLQMTNCASPKYLETHGTPKAIDDLDHHRIVHYSSTLSPETPTFEYRSEGDYLERPMHSVVTVNNVDAYQAAAIAGLGIIQVPRVGVLDSFRTGELVEVMPELSCAPMPVSILHIHGRSVPRRVRVVTDWITAIMRPYFDHMPPAAALDVS
ncbi:MAG: LysR family transcriptional regulator [Myxococcales bacterium]|nr:LysR family transcriptional regulator [Myxococcales bacterium]